MSKEGSNIRESDENTLFSLMSRSVPMLESTIGFWSLRTFDVSNLSCGHLIFYFVIANSICFILQKFPPFNNFLDRINNQLSVGVQIFF